METTNLRLMPKFKSHHVGPEDLEELKRSIKFTADARFIASRRLSRWSLCYLLAVNFASLIATIYSIAPKYIQVYSLKPNEIELIIIAYSLFFMMLSLVLTTFDFKSSARQHHNCAMKLNHLLKVLKFTKPINNRQTLKWIDEYNLILKEYENHSPNDYVYAQLEFTLKQVSDKKVKKFLEKVGKWLNYLTVQGNRIMVAMESYCHVIVIYMVLAFPAFLQFYRTFFGNTP